MVRLDKFLSDCNVGTRSQIKEQIRKGQVCVNGTMVKKADTKVSETVDQVMYCGELCTYRKYAYYMLHKPKGVVSATNDNTAATVLSLLTDVTDKSLFPVGRLDKDTTGLLLITNDGGLAHDMLSPKKHVDKTYLAKIRKPLHHKERVLLEQGVDIGDEALTLPAKVQITDENHILLTIQEGRFHQVKRMLKAVGNEVICLKRISFGPLTLEDSLREGEFRALTAKEVEALQQLKS